jgi:hypothetical protein
MSRRRRMSIDRPILTRVHSTGNRGVTRRFQHRSQTILRQSDLRAHFFPTKIAARATINHKMPVIPGTQVKNVPALQNKALEVGASISPAHSLVRPAQSLTLAMISNSPHNHVRHRQDQRASGGGEPQRTRPRADKVRISRRKLI